MGNKALLHLHYLFKNSKNQNIIRQKEIIEGWLCENSQAYIRRRSREATKNNYNDLKTLLIQDVSHYVVSETGRKPLILPVFLEIKK